MQHSVVVLQSLIFILVVSAMSALAQVNTDPAISHDFDFLFGSWKSHNTFLNGRLRGSHDWIDFDGTLEAEPLLGGLGNIDRYEAVRNGKTVLGTTLRLFNPKTQEWSLYWADNIRAGILQPPMVGNFHGDKGDFFGDEEVDGRKVLCRFRWTRTNPDAPKWEQAFSDDGGKTWETNWIVTFTR